MAGSEESDLFGHFSSLLTISLRKALQGAGIRSRKVTFLGHFSSLFRPLFSPFLAGAGWLSNLKSLKGKLFTAWPTGGHASCERAESDPFGHFLRFLPGLGWFNEGSEELFSDGKELFSWKIALLAPREMALF